MAKKILLTIVCIVLACYVTTLVFPNECNVKINVEGAPVASGNSTPVSGTPSSTPTPDQTTTAPAPSATPDSSTSDDKTDAPAGSDKTDDKKDDSSDKNDSGMPQTNQEIVEKYTELVNKMKAEQPGYKKKEYQALPEEHRNLGSLANTILDLVAGYMTTEEECEEIVRDKNAGTINDEMPIYGSDKGCVLTDYNAVSWAKCEDLGDGTYKLSFSLNAEKNCEPTSPETLTPTSAHGAVMSPLSMSDIQREVDNVTSKVPGLNVNTFELTYNDCEFSCIYDPATDHVLSITHHNVIDISCDVDMFVANINGSARLLDEMFIYDITW